MYAIRSYYDIHLDAAAEYYIDEGFDRLLDNDELLRISGKYILLETSYIAKPLNFEEVIFKLLSKGYLPILAHPERYRYIKNLDAEYHTLKKLGILFQVNINSFGGHYGKDRITSYNVCYTKLLRNGMAECLEEKDTLNTGDSDDRSKYERDVGYTGTL